MNVVLIVPTGLGAAIGGHAGDANPAATLFGKCCDKLITHPNVVNGSDMNEMPENALYVEGSILDRFLRGEIELRERRHNKIVVAVNKPVQNETVNAVNASKVVAGVSAEIVELDTPLIMEGCFAPDGCASGRVAGWKEAAAQLRTLHFDAMALHTPIDVTREVALRYFREGGVNPWGAVEAIASKHLATALNKPVAHAPLENVAEDDHELLDIYRHEVVDPRMAPEAISTCYLHCVLKGLNRAPIIGKGLSVDDVDCLISPDGCFGPPHKACLEHGIPVIVVRENTTVTNHVCPTPSIHVENYWEAAGVVMAMRAGIDPCSVRRIGAAWTEKKDCRNDPRKRRDANAATKAE